MEEDFKTEIITPEKIIFSENVTMITLPCYEGDMSVLKNHISIITFLRPGIIKVQKSNEIYQDFFVQDGTVEFFNNSLAVLSSSVVDIKNISKKFVDDLNKDIQENLLKENVTDHERYILNHKIDTLKEIDV